MSNWSSTLCDLGVFVYQPAEQIATLEMKVGMRCRGSPLWMSYSAPTACGSRAPHRHARQARRESSCRLRSRPARPGSRRAASKSSLLADSNFTLRDGHSTGSRAYCRRSARTSAGFGSRQWLSGSGHLRLRSVPGRSGITCSVIPGGRCCPSSCGSRGFIGRGPGSARLAPLARKVPGRGRRSTGFRVLPDRR